MSGYVITKDPVTLAARNAEGLWEQILAHAGALRVAAGIVGDPSVCCLVSDTAAPGANDVLTSEDGFKGFEALLVGAMAAVGTGDAYVEMVAVSYSTVAGDHVGVAALLATAAAEFDGTPSVPPVLIPNTFILRGDGDICGAVWDGTTEIKTIGVRGVGMTPGQCNVMVKVVS